MYRGCNKQGRVFLTFLTFQLSTIWKWTSIDLEVLVHFQIVERRSLESLESLENILNFQNFFRGLKRPLEKLKTKLEGKKIKKKWFAAVEN